MSFEEIIEKTVEHLELLNVYIVIMHWEDAEKVDLKEFPDNLYIVETIMAEPGKILCITDKNLRKELWQYIKEGKVNYRRGEKNMSGEEMTLPERYEGFKKRR